MDSFAMCRNLACSEGLLVGGSAGLNVHAAVKLAESMQEPCTIVTILCDMGTYQSLTMSLPVTHHVFTCHSLCLNLSLRH